MLETIDSKKTLNNLHAILLINSGEDCPSIAKLILGILNSVAEFERNIIRERQAEGIRKAREKGVYVGRA